MLRFCPKCDVWRSYELDVQLCPKCKSRFVTTQDAISKLPSGHTFMLSGT